MTTIVPGATVVHLPARIDWQGTGDSSHAIAECGRQGVPTEVADLSEHDICKSCQQDNDG